MWPAGRPEMQCDLKQQWLQSSSSKHCSSLAVASIPPRQIPAAAALLLPLGESAAAAISTAIAPAATPATTPASIPAAGPAATSASVPASVPAAGRTAPAVTPAVTPAARCAAAPAVTPRPLNPPLFLRLVPLTLPLYSAGAGGLALRQRPCLLRFGHVPLRACRGRGEKAATVE